MGHIQKIMVVGLGSIGRRHVQNLKTVCPDVSIAAWKQSGKARSLDGMEKWVDTVFYTAEDALAWKADAALVTNPATQHIETARLLAEADIPLFVEKPLSHTLDGVDELLQFCKQRSVNITLGYNFRFYAPFLRIRELLQEGRIGRLMSVRAEVGQYLPDWRPTQDYRQSVSARSELGGGVLLELSHEIDYIRFLAGEIVSVSAQASRLSNLEINAEDTADLLFKLSSGVMGSIHLDMTDRAQTRKCRLVGTEGTILWDGIKHQVDFYLAKNKSWEAIYSGENYDRNEMYLEELRHFVDCVENKKTPSVTGNDGRRALQIVLAAKQSAKIGKVVTI